MLLGEGDGGMGHALLIVGAIGGKMIAVRIQCFTHAGDVAVPENSETAREQRCALAVDLGVLRCQIAHQRLCHGQADSLVAAHGETPAAWAPGWTAASRHALISSA